MPCIFCGEDRPLTLEHVFGKWTRVHIKDPGGGIGTYRRTTIRAGDPADELQEHKGEAATHTVRSVCAACNNGWMSRLEGDAQPFLATMIRGSGRTYYERGMTTIATWIVKTSLVAGSKFPPLLPRSFYEQVRSDGRPSDNTRIWLASTPYGQQHYSNYRQMRMHADDAEPPEEPNAFCGLISIGGFAGFVVSWLDRMPDMTVTGPRLSVHHV